MIEGMRLYLFKSPTEGIDITNLVSEIKWKGRKGAASRNLTVKIIDDDGYNHARSGIDVEKGHQCILSLNGKELFRGIIMSQSQSDKKLMSFTAYDMGIYLSNNKDTFAYENKTADEIFVDVCKRYNLPIGTVDKCSFRIPELTKSKTTAFDVISDALSLDYDNTGIRHYVYSSNGKLHLITRRRNILQWVFETGQNIITYSYNRSIEDIKTRIKGTSKNPIQTRTQTPWDKKSDIYSKTEQISLKIRFNWSYFRPFFCKWAQLSRTKHESFLKIYTDTYCRPDSSARFDSTHV